MAMAHLEMQTKDLGQPDEVQRVGVVTGTSRRRPWRSMVLRFTVSPLASEPRREGVLPAPRCLPVVKDAWVCRLWTVRKTCTGLRM